MKHRKIIQIISDVEGVITWGLEGEISSGICFLCDDGSVWAYSRKKDGHYRIDTADIENADLETPKPK